MPKHSQALPHCNNNNQQHSVGLQGDEKRSFGENPLFPWLVTLGLWLASHPDSHQEIIQCFARFITRHFGQLTCIVGGLQLDTQTFVFTLVKGDVRSRAIL